MSTIHKALSVLDLFSENEPNLGTSEIARRLGWDKSNVQRYVRDLTSKGILEQDLRDRSYYLGPAITRLALMRERTNPIAREIMRILTDLVAITGETAHASSVINDQLITHAVVETTIRGTRVYVDPAEPLPFHASGSGIAFLSRAPDSLRQSYLQANLPAFTDRTHVDMDSIDTEIAKANERGYAIAYGTFERDVTGVAAPVLGFDGYSIGAIAVATPNARFNSESEQLIINGVIESAAAASRIYGGE